MIRGTIVLPFSNKGEVNKIWFDHFKSNLTLDPAEWKIVLFDTSNNMHGEHLYPQFRNMQFAKVVYDQVPNRFLVQGEEHFPKYLKMGTAIAHVWNDCRKHIEGDIVLMIEDDILIPKYGFERLINNLMDNPQCGMIAGVQRFKQSPNNNRKPGDILAWTNQVVHTNADFQGMDLLEVGSVATGMIVTHAKLFNSVNMSKITKEYHASQDIAYCRYLNDIHKLNVLLDPMVETVHVDLMYKRFGRLSALRPVLIKDYVGYQSPAPEVEPSRTDGAPIFLCGTSGRTGSTWIQRILMSHPEIMMYGEPQGAVSAVDRFVDEYFRVRVKSTVKQSSDLYKKFGAGGFIPNLAPYINGCSETRRRVIEALYGDNEKPVWGIKSIFWTPTRIMKMFRSFPKASFIFIDRDDSELIQSFNKVSESWWNRTWSDVEGRVKNTREFLNMLPVGMYYLKLNHTEIKDDPEGVCNLLELFLKLESGSLNREVARLKVSASDDDNQTMIQ